MLDASFETTPHNFNERNLAPKLLSGDDAQALAMADFGKIQELNGNQIEQFVNNHVRVVRIGNVDVTIIDQEHEDFKGELNPVLGAYLKSGRTRTAAVEYFMPELQQNATNLPVIGSKAYDAMLALKKEGRGSMFMAIADIMREQNKTISCVDIANKLDYEAYYALMKGSILPALSAIFPQLPYTPMERLLLAAALPVGGWFVDELLEAVGKGIYDKQGISKLENLYLSMEESRRIYASKGLNQLAKDYNKEYPSKAGQGNPQIVVVYPRAHAIRIANYMTSQDVFTKTAKFIKGFLTHLPNLDYSYRTYTWKDTLAKISEKPELAAWQLTTSKKVPLI